MRGDSVSVSRSHILLLAVMGVVSFGCAGPPSRNSDGACGTLAGRIVSAVAYPGVALRNKWEGSVVLTVVVGQDLRLASIATKKSSGYATLDKAVVTTVESLVFTSKDIGTNTFSVTFTIPDAKQLHTHPDVREGIGARREGVSPE